MVEIALPSSGWKPGDDAFMTFIDAVLVCPRPGVLAGQTCGDPASDEISLLWPTGFTAHDLDDGTIVVCDPEGTVTVQVGDRFQVAGGFVSLPGAGQDVDDTDAFAMCGWPVRVEG